VAQIVEPHAVDAECSHGATARLRERVGVHRRTVSTQTPNILLQSESFRSWVNSDLVAAYRRALDAHIVDEVDRASIPGGGGGSNPFEDVLYTVEAIAAAGYTADTVVLFPADALAIRLLIMSSGDSYAFSQSIGQLPSFVVSTSVDDGAGFAMDSNALGTLFVGPFVFASFEENNGTSRAPFAPRARAGSSFSGLTPRRPCPELRRTCPIISGRFPIVGAKCCQRSVRRWGSGHKACGPGPLNRPDGRRRSGDQAHADRPGRGQPHHRGDHRD
jgi:hypothetical protein